MVSLPAMRCHGAQSSCADQVLVAHAEPSAPGDSQWHIFNDFSVKPVSAAEALTFNARWKMPSVLVYQLKTANNNLDTEWIKNIDTSVLHIDFKYVHSLLSS